MAEAGCRFETSDEAIACLEAAELAAADPSAPGFIAATAILLADCLQGGLSVDGMSLTYTTNASAFAKLAPRARAVLLAGFVAIRKRQREPVFDAPDTCLLISTDRSAIMVALRQIATSMSEDALINIANADYGCGVDRHLEALREVLAAPDGWRTQERLWYPSEVVELVSHVPDQAGFAGATALMLMDAIEAEDIRGDMDYRWQNNAKAYFAMPEAGPILAGFRHLYETIPEWNPYWLAYFDVADHRAITLPPAAERYLVGETND